MRRYLGSAVGLVVAAVVVAAATAGTTHRAAPPDDRLIAFEDAGGIFLMRADGGRPAAG